MKLADTVAQYVAHKQAMGMRFHTERRTLQSFCAHCGNVDLAQIEPEQVRCFLAGTGPITRFWQRKHEALRGFYRFAIARGYVPHAPLPKTVPKPAQAFVPYVYSHAEVRHLLAATASCHNPRSLLDPSTCRTLLLLLYGAALRISEALALTLADVDLAAGLLQVRDSKFYKTRIVPISADLVGVLTQYLTHRAAGAHAPDGPFLLSRTGKPVTRSAAENTFQRLRQRAGVMRHDGARYQPRLHDLRHSSAVHRLVSWYRSGADVQRLLPHLATYLGHLTIAATQRYLTLTPQLLEAANQRFERYAMEENHHD